ncbi:MAG: hypothetical protein ACRDHD_11320 [Candidatus Limnocylindria bacterium]
MTHDDQLIDQLEGYLDDYQGHTPLPDTVRDAVREKLATLKQVAPLPGPMRNIRMSVIIPSPVRYGLVAAAVLTAAILGTALISRGPNLGGPGATPTPTPTPPPLAGDPLEPGTYSIARGSLNATISVPAGWSSLDSRGVAKGDNQTFAVVVFWPFPTELAEVYSDPCHWKTSAIEPPVGPTVDDLADALAAQEMRGDAVPTDVTLGGYEGKVLEMSVPTDIDFTDCDDGSFYSWAGRFHQGPGQIDVVYILDVEGQRQVLIAHHMPGVSAADLAEQQAILDSIDLLP